MTTTTGPVRGTAGAGVVVFPGIPYASARRFAPPEAVAPWAAPRPAAGPGPACPQPNGPLGRPPEGTAEDCLVLNVWRPQDHREELPVLVFLHGGAFTTGSGGLSWYDGSSLARRGAVVVTVNYRLGALGWLHLDGIPGAEPGSGNLGLLDQLAALWWVRDNVERFGGDPERICLFGQSAGAMSVGTLLGVAEATGVIRRAICQSGAQAHVRSAQAASAVTESVLASLGLLDPTIEDLRRVPVPALLDAQVRVSGQLRANGALPFAPVVDGVVLAEHPAAAVEAGTARGVDLLCGVTAEEMRFYNAFGTRDLDEARFEARIAALVAPGPDPASSDAGVVRALADGYRRLVPEATPADRWDLVLGDAVFGLPAEQLVRRQRGHAPTWSYLFAYRGAGMGGRFGACHAIDLPFVFDNLDAAGVDVLVGPAPDARTRSLARLLADAWVAFAASGDPRVEDHLSAWQPSTASTTGRSTAIFDRSVAVAVDPLGARYALWPGTLWP